MRLRSCLVDGRLPQGVVKVKSVGSYGWYNDDNSNNGSAEGPMVGGGGARANKCSRYLDDWGQYY